MVLFYLAYKSKPKDVPSELISHILKAPNILKINLKNVKNGIIHHIQSFHLKNYTTSWVFKKEV